MKLKHIKINSTVVANLTESCVASGLPFDTGTLDFDKAVYHVAKYGTLVIEMFDDLDYKDGAMYYKGVRLVSTDEEALVLLCEGVDIKDGQLYITEFEQTATDFLAEHYPNIGDPKLELIYRTLKRCKTLASAKSGSGHDCFLKGIDVSMNLTAPQYFWLQWERYHFQDTVSSQSTMHKLVIGKEFGEFVSEQAISTLTDLITLYNTKAPAEEYDGHGIAPTTHQERFMAVVQNIPEGIMLTRRVKLSYLQLRTMLAQRENHKLAEWSEFREWIITELPWFDFLIPTTRSV